MHTYNFVIMRLYNYACFQLYNNACMPEKNFVVMNRGIWSLAFVMVIRIYKRLFKKTQDIPSRASV